MKTNIVEPNSLVLQEHSQGLGSRFPTSHQCHPGASFGHKIRGGDTLWSGVQKRKNYIYLIFFFVNIIH